MILKVNDTDNYNISMSLDVDYKHKKIDIFVRLRDKVKGVGWGTVYPAKDFDAALDRFDEAEKEMVTKYGR